MNHQITSKSKKLVLWLILCLIVSAIFFQEVWTNIGTLLSLSYIQHHGVYPWFVLSLCFLWIWLKREEISEKMCFEKIYSRPPFIILGLALFGLALLLPGSRPVRCFSIVIGLCRYFHHPLWGSSLHTNHSPGCVWLYTRISNINHKVCRNPILGGNRLGSCINIEGFWLSNSKPGATNSIFRSIG